MEAGTILRHQAQTSPASYHIKRHEGMVRMQVITAAVVAVSVAVLLLLPETMLVMNDQRKERSGYEEQQPRLQVPDEQVPSQEKGSDRVLEEVVLCPLMVA